MSTAPDSTDVDYDQLLRANLERVFNERDATRRRAAIDELFVEDPVVCEPADIVRGRDAIDRTVSALLDQFGADFSFVPRGRAVGHHGLGVLHWDGVRVGGHVEVSGMDAAEVSNGRIVRLWVLLTPPTVQP